MGGKKFYAVAAGRRTGIYGSWNACQKQTSGYSGAKFKSFKSEQDAIEYLRKNCQVAEQEQARRQRQRQQRVKKEGEEESDDGNGGNNSDDAVYTYGKNKRGNGAVETESTGQEESTTKSHSGSSTCGNVATARFKVQVHFDGGARGNPGTAGCGSVVSIRAYRSKDRQQQQQQNPYRQQSKKRRGNSRGEIEIHNRTMHVREFVGDRNTNNEAEYRGLIRGLQVAREELRRNLLPGNTTGEAAAAAEGTAPIRIEDDDRGHDADDDTTSNAASCYYKDAEFIVQGDSDLIIRQLNGEYSVKSPNLKPLYGEAMQHISKMKDLVRNHNDKVLRDANNGGYPPLPVPPPQLKFFYEHVYRRYNSMSDALANIAMDARRSWITISDDQHQRQYRLHDAGDW